MKRLFFLMILLCASLPTSAQQVLRFATLAPEGTPWMKELRVAASEIEKTTQGRVKIKIFPGGVMGNDTVVLRKIRLGQLNGGVLTSSELTGVNPDAGVYGLPFVFSSWDQVAHARRNVDPILERGFEQNGFHMLGASGVGFAYLMSSQPMRNRDDLRAAKLWVPQNDAIAERTFREGGVSPILLPIGDVFTSLQTGMINTVANTPSGAVALQWHSRVKHILDLRLSYIVGFIVIDSRPFKLVSAADRVLVDKAFKSAAARVDAGIRSSDEQAMQAMLKQGMRLDKLAPAEEAYFRQVGRKVIDDVLAENLLSAEAVSALLRAIESAPSSGASP